MKKLQKLAKIKFPDSDPGKLIAAFSDKNGRIFSLFTLKGSYFLRSKSDNWIQSYDIHVDSGKFVNIDFNLDNYTRFLICTLILFYEQEDDKQIEDITRQHSEDRFNR